MVAEKSMVSIYDGGDEIFNEKSNKTFRKNEKCVAKENMRTGNIPYDLHVLIKLSNAKFSTEFCKISSIFMYFLLHFFNFIEFCRAL